MLNNHRARLLIPIWGKRYIEEFVRVALPTLLAPGNLPALAARTDLEALILTSQGSFKYFEKQVAFAELTAVCKVRFLPIDDLIVGGLYGVTLTLAYARGILDSGDAQTSTYFVFMNADFALADGSLRTLAEKIAEGHPCILGPSLRGCSEQISPILAAQVNQQTHQLSVEPRSLVRLTLNNLHPTAIGRTVTQNLISCELSDQLYWQVDASTLLARSHLMFMLAIKPERSLAVPVNSYCDYGLAPELVPSGKVLVLADSDTFFMLELQPTAQEREFLHIGPLGMAGIARALSTWTTPEHRRIASHDVIFHAGNLPLNLGAVRAQATAVISRLHSVMGPPISHIAHPNWAGGVHHWLMLRDQAGASSPRLPRELDRVDISRTKGRDDCPVDASDRKRGLNVKWVNPHTTLVGTQPFVRFWRYNWTDCRPVRNWLKVVAGKPEGRHLLVCGPHSPLLRSVPGIVPMARLELETLRDDGRWQEWLEENPHVRYSTVLCQMNYGATSGDLRPLLEPLARILDENATLALFLMDERAELGQGALGQYLVGHIEALLPSGWPGLHVRASFSGGVVKWLLRRLEVQLLSLLRKGCIWRRFLAAAAVAVPWAILCGLTALNNLRLRKGQGTCPMFCTSVFLTLSRGDGPLASR